MFNMEMGKMPYHIFLTGEKQIGKTTLINSAVTKLGLKTSGLISFATTEEDCLRKVFIKGVNKNSRHELVGVCKQGKILEVHTENFDNYGCELISVCSDTELIVIDEVGFLEKGAKRYLSKIMELLEQTDIHVIGVFRKDSSIGLEIKNHPNVKTFVVKEANRDRLVPVVERLVRNIKTN